MDKHIIINSLKSFATVKKEIDNIKNSETEIDVYLIDSTNEGLVDEKIEDGKLANKDINALIKIVELRGELIDKIRRKEITLREYNGAL